MCRQLTLSDIRELVVDNFAGGGGASTGIAWAIGRSPDIAINHDLAAIAMHKANHPDTYHYCESVWDVDPRRATQGYPVALAWFSPDCTHFSKAKGGKPVSRKTRGLAWVAIRWAATARPRVIILENVEEFVTWGPLVRREDGNLYPDPARKGQTFQAFVRALRRHGYHVEWRELRACDYGAPTIRRRLFLIARCDGRPIIWPQPTHGDPRSEGVTSGRLKPWRTAAEIIDWFIPCPSIFDRKRSLAENTLRRIARGIHRFVIDNPNPFIVPVGLQGAGGNKFALAAAYLDRQFTRSTGHPADEPLGTVTAGGGGKTNLVTTLLQLGQGPHSAVGFRPGEVRAFLLKYYGTTVGQRLDEPLHTITTKHRLGLVTVHGQDYRIVDIGMRMLEPHELFAAQGFPPDYIIDRDPDGRRLSKAEQVARCGNAVPPQFAEALVRANLPELCSQREEVERHA